MKENLNVSNVHITVDGERDWDTAHYFEGHDEEWSLLHQAYYGMSHELRSLGKIGLRGLDLKFRFFKPLEAVWERKVLGNRYSSQKENRPTLDWPTVKWPDMLDGDLEKAVWAIPPCHHAHLKALEDSVLPTPPLGADLPRD